MPIQYVGFLLGVGMKSPVVFKGCDTSSIFQKGLYVRPEHFLLRLVLLFRVPNLDDIVHILPVRMPQDTFIDMFNRNLTKVTW